jgi:Flp pilus assembly secretin CpaC
MSSSLLTCLRAFCAFWSLAIGILLWPAAATAEPSFEAAIGVNVDQAKLVKLPARAATIVVGNPLIADVTLQSGGIVVVTGKGYGATNFIAMDRSGEILVDRVIQVEGPTDQRGRPRVLQLHADLPEAGDAWRRRQLFQIRDRSGRLAQQPGRQQRLFGR